MAPKLTRTKSSHRPGSRLSGLFPTGENGEKPAEMVTHFTKLSVKQKQSLHESLTAPTRMNCPGFLEKLDHNRIPIPINEKRRVKAPVLREGDVEYVPATYAKLERDDYIVWQAPNKETFPGFWRNVWQDGVRLILCLSDKFSESDNDCYPYFPRSEKSPLSVQDGRFTIRLTKKTENKGFSTYELEVACIDGGDAAESVGTKKTERSTEDEQANADESKAPRQITIFHYENWTPETWPNIDTLAAFIHGSTKKEMQLMRKTIDQFAPPVLIQGHTGIGRTAVAWVGIILMKDIEKKDCFDIPDLIHKFMRLRPGAFTSKLYYFVTYAAGFRMASMGGWIAEEEAKRHVKEIEQAYKNSFK